MSNEQLYLAIGVPLVVNGLLALLLNGRIGTIENLLSTRISSVESRMLSLENTFTARFDLIMGRMTELEKQIHER
jgi:hypothetical protein